VLDVYVTGTGAQVERDRSGSGDVIVDGDIVVQLAVVGLADADGVAGLLDRRVLDDLGDASVNCGRGIPTCVDVRLDVNLAVAAGGDLPIRSLGL